jgi:hypothetical protein
MALIDLQRDVIALCLSDEPRPEQFAALGDERIWRLYREMIRTRLLRELRQAFRRTYEAVGKELFDRAFEHHLRTLAPRTRFFHALAAGFATSVGPWLRGEASAPAYAADLVLYEAALREVADLSDAVISPIGEFAFDKVTVFAPAIRLLDLAYAVHRKPDPEGVYERGRFFLCVHRGPTDKRPRIWTLNALSHDLLQRMLPGQQNVSDCIAQMATQRGIAIDEKFLDGLCTVLADFIEKGVILGAR